MRHIRLLFTLSLLLSTSLFLHAQSAQIPGVVISHIAKSSGRYVGSPSICVLPDGTYLASHDEFGPKSDEGSAAITRVFASSDRGKSWHQVARLTGQFWSTLFCLNGKVYVLGTNKGHGNIVIRRSDDGGHTWTTPTDAQSGLLRTGEYHTAPVPVIVHKGRVWRAVEYATSPDDRWPQRYSAMMMSAKVGSDLLKASSWRFSNYLRSDTTWLGGKFRGWLEGNAVVAPDGKIYDVLRCETPDTNDEYAALVSINKSGRHASFDPGSGFSPFPGGAKKFTIRYDEATHRYWTLCNPRYRQVPKWNHYSVRNMLVLCSSTDLKHWTMHQMTLFHPERWHHAYQYVDWQFDGNDIILVSRTAFDDEEGGAHSFHDANYLTFHRIQDFRKLVGKQLDLHEYETVEDK